MLCKGHLQVNPNSRTVPFFLSKIKACASLLLRVNPQPITDTHTPLTGFRSPQNQVQPMQHLILGRTKSGTVPEAGEPNGTRFELSLKKGPNKPEGYSQSSHSIQLIPKHLPSLNSLGTPTSAFCKLTLSHILQINLMVPTQQIYRVLPSLN